MNNKRIFYILIFSFFCKVALALLVPIYADEAYYFVWTLHPQLSYFDHPPMVSWFISLGKIFFPPKSALSLRFLFVLASTFTMLTWYFILKRKNFSQKNIECFFILILLNPLLGPGSILASPDVPLVLFWSLSYYFFLEVIEKKTALAYALLGVFLGLGFCSKYHIVLFVLSGLAYLYWSKTYKQLVRSKILITLFFGFLFSLPVVLWNYQNDWVSFSFQLKHGFGRSTYDWTWTAGFIAGQILILNPFLLPQLIKKTEPQIDRFFGLGQFFFFITSSFKAVVEANWPITSHLHGTSYVSQNLPKKKFRQALGYWLFIYLTFTVLYLLPQAQVLFKNQYNSEQLDEIVPLITQYKPLYGPNYQVSSLLTWITGTDIYKLKGLTRRDLFDSLEQSAPKEKEYYVLKHMTSFWPDDFDKTVTITLLQTFEKQQLQLFKVSNE